MREKNFADTFGRRVLQCRNSRNWTQEELANHAHVSVQFISAIEQGRTNVRTDYLVQLAETLNVSTDFLLRGEINIIDASNLAKQIESLDGQEFIHLQNIVIEYCKSHKK